MSTNLVFTNWGPTLWDSTCSSQVSLEKARIQHETTDPNRLIRTHKDRDM